jgi:hypothetical protein
LASSSKFCHRPPSWASARILHNNIFNSQHKGTSQNLNLHAVENCTKLVQKLVLSKRFLYILSKYFWQQSIYYYLK